MASRIKNPPESQQHTRSTETPTPTPAELSRPRAKATRTAAADEWHAQNRGIANATAEARAGGRGGGSANRGTAVQVRSAPGRSDAGRNFDQSFATARKAGMKEFTWNGKRYSTKVK